ncbi:hypothetical protein D3C77_342650 [compost metagenome]
MAFALTTNTRCGSLLPPALSSLLVPSRPPKALMPASTGLIPDCGAFSATASATSPSPLEPARPSITPRPMLATPRAILRPLSIVFSATNPAPAVARPSTTVCDPSDKLVSPCATALMPLATRSVAGRMASPILRMASLTACPVSAHICAEDSRRSARFLSRMPAAFFESFFSCSYNPRFAA